MQKKGHRESLKKLRAELSSSLGQIESQVHYRPVSPPPQGEMEHEDNSSERETTPSEPVEPVADKSDVEAPEGAAGGESFVFNPQLDPGDPANRLPVNTPTLIPVQDDEANLIGYKETLESAAQTQPSAGLPESSLQLPQAHKLVVPEPTRQAQPAKVSESTEESQHPILSPLPKNGKNGKNGENLGARPKERLSEDPNRNPNKGKKPAFEIYKVCINKEIWENFGNTLIK